MRSVLDEVEGRARRMEVRAEAMEPFAKVCPRCGSRFDAAASFCQKDGASLRLLEEQTDPRIGQILLDQFRIEERIGVGGMGAVYRARQSSLGRDVAIKILHPDLAANPDAVRRFQREARISTALDHPNVVRVFLFGQLPDGSLYLVMELLRGRTLAELARVERNLPVHRALHIATQACDGVGEAHSQGIVHRDVKPENVFLITKGRDPDFVKVLDFGIARVLQGEDATMATQSGLVFGTARYISPEGAAGERTDARSDVYSLGIMTYQLLCGETPFDGSSPVTLLMKHIHDSPPHLKSRAGGAHVPDAIADVVMRALTKNPEGRYEDAVELSEVLRAAAHRAGLDVVRLRSGASSISSLAGERRDPTGPSIRDPKGIGMPRTMMMPEHGARASAAPVDTTSMRDAPDPFGGGSPFGGGATEDLPIAGLGSRRMGKRARAVAAQLVGAFVVGAVLVGGGALAVRALTAPDPAAAEATSLVERAEAALAEDRIDQPADDSVRAYTDRLLVIRPDDADATRLRRAAADRLLALAATAEGGGQSAQAIDLYRRALDLAGDDARARDAIARLEADRAVPARDVGVSIMPAPMQREPVLITATVAEDATVDGDMRPRFVIVRGARRLAGPIVAAPGGSPGTWIASYTFASAGVHRIKFVAGTNEQDHYELTTEVDVARAVRPGTGRPREDDPPVTTQGYAAPPLTGPTIIDIAPPPPQQVAATTPTIISRPVEQPPPPPIHPLGPTPDPDPPPPPTPWTSQ